MPSLSLSGEPPWLRSARATWRWWTTELTDMLPFWITDRRTSAPTSIVRISGDGVEVERVADGIGERLRDNRPIEHHDAESWAQLAELLSSTKAKIVLTSPDVFDLTLELPAAAAGRMRAAVGLQLLHAAPVDPEDIYWNYAIRAASSERVTATVAMGLRSRLDQLAELFHDNNVPMPPVFGEAGGTLLLLRAGEIGFRDRDATLNRHVVLASLALLILSPILTLVAAELMIWKNDARAEALQAALKPELATARELIRNESLRTALRPVLQLPAISETLEELAVRLPTTAHLTQLELRSDRKLRFTTDSIDGADVIAQRLDGAAYLANAEVRDQSAMENRIRTIFEAAAR